MKKLIFGCLLIMTTGLVSCSKDDTNDKVLLEGQMVQEKESLSSREGEQFDFDSFYEEAITWEKVSPELYDGVVEAAITGNCRTCNCVSTGSELSPSGALTIHHVVCNTGTHVIVCINNFDDSVIWANVETKWSVWHLFD